MKKLTQSIFILTSLSLSTLALRRLAIKQHLSYLSLLFTLAFTSTIQAQVLEVTITAPPFNSDVIFSMSQPEVPRAFDFMADSRTPGSYGAAKRAEAEKQKEEFCKNKAQKIADADAKASQCKLDAQTTFVTKASECTQITKATISIGGQGSVNGDVNRALAAFNIKAGAVLGANVSGTLEWNPNADCRIKLDDSRVLSKETCDSIAAATKAKLAGCP